MRSIAEGIGEGDFAMLPFNPPTCDDGPRALDTFELLRDLDGLPDEACCTDACLVASTTAFSLGVVSGPLTFVQFPLGDSKSPYCGRGGRSGVILPFLGSDSDAERSRLTKLGVAAPLVSHGDTAARQDGMTDSLMLRACLFDVAGLLNGNFVSSSPNLIRPCDGD